MDSGRPARVYGRPLAAFGVIMIAVMWTYEGWYYVAFAAGEIANPARTVPRALIMGTIALTTIYVAVNLAYVRALAGRGDRGRDADRREGGDGPVGPIGATLVAASVVVSTFGCNVAGVIASSRVCFAMAADGVSFRPRPACTPVHRTPHVALVITSIWSVLLTLTGGYEALFTYVTFASVLFGTLGGLAIFVLRLAASRSAAPVPRAGLPGDPRALRPGIVRARMEHADGAPHRIDRRSVAGGARPAVLLALVGSASAGPRDAGVRT